MDPLGAELLVVVAAGPAADLVVGLPAGLPVEPLAVAASAVVELLAVALAEPLVVELMAGVDLDVKPVMTIRVVEKMKVVMNPLRNSLKSYGASVP